MPQLKVGIQLASLKQPIKRALQTAARLGADAVEIDARNALRPGELSQTGVRQFRKLLDDLNLKVCAVSFRTRRGYDVADDLQERIDATKRAMQFAHSLGANVLINQVGRVPDEPSGTGWDMLVEALDDLGRYGQHAGALLAAETGSEEGTSLRALIESIPAGGVGVNFDPGNLIVNGFSAEQSLQALADHVLHVHAKDGVRDLAQGRGIEVPLGRGTADFPVLLGVLEQHAYHGYLTVERERSEAPVEEIDLALQYLKNL